MDRAAIGEAADAVILLGHSYGATIITDAAAGDQAVEHLGLSDRDDPGHGRFACVHNHPFLSRPAALASALATIAS